MAANIDKIALLNRESSIFAKKIGIINFRIDETSVPCGPRPRLEKVRLEKVRQAGESILPLRTMKTQLFPDEGRAGYEPVWRCPSR